MAEVLLGPFQTIADFFNRIREAILEFFSAVVDFFRSLFDFIVNAAAEILRRIMAFILAPAINAAIEVGKAIVSQLKSVHDQFLKALAEIQRQVGCAFADFLAKLYPKLKKIFAYNLTLLFLRAAFHDVWRPRPGEGMVRGLGRGFITTMAKVVAAPLVGTFASEIVFSMIPQPKPNMCVEVPVAEFTVPEPKMEEIKEELLAKGAVVDSMTL
ncbi:MAG: hypothetical protein C4291_14475, partial [Candidatus Dadabacteria bacterium]